jgi:hypothetical protein
MVEFSIALSSLNACETTRTDKDVSAIFTELEVLTAKYDG